MALTGAAGDRNPKEWYVFTQAARYEPRAWVEGQDRFPAGATLVVVTAAGRRAAAPGFRAAADAAVSYDGAKILFSGKQAAGERWQVWEVAVAGGAPKRITSGAGDCVRPLYLADGRVVYTRISSAGSHLEVAPLAGGAAVRLTFGAARVMGDDVLHDGRILFESVSAGGQRVRELLTVYPDGTGVEAMRCDHGVDRGEARQVAGGDVVFAAGDRLARFTSTQAKQAVVEGLDRQAAGPVAEAAPGIWIVALRGKNGRYGLHRWDRASGEMRALETPVEAQAVQPAMLAARVPPLRFPSALVTTRTTGNLLCLDARVSKTPIDGAIRQVRFFVQDARGSATALGEAPVESDGSFYVQLPADRPVRLELLDAAGRTLRGEHGWFWMRPSEQRVCVGCHAGPEKASENKVPAVLLRTTIPANLLGTSGRGK